MPAVEMTPSALRQISGNLLTFNNTYSSLLDDVENKLNCIIDKRVPKSEEQPKQTDPADMIEEINRQSSRFDLNNERLKKLLNHLCEIV